MKKMIVFLSLGFFLISSVSTLYSAEKTESFPVVKDRKWGYIDSKGKVVIDFQFENADTFKEGLAPVRKGDKVGYINPKGEMVIDAQFTDAWAFEGGIAPVKVGNSLGYINKKGQYIWNPTY